MKREGHRGVDGDEDKREARKQALRKAAYKRFSERGYHLTTVDDICAEAGISKGSFYWHYDSKQAVLLAIVDGWAAEVERSLTEHFRSALEGADRRASVTRGLDALAHRLRKLMPLWLEFLSQAQREPAIREGLSVFHRRVRRATHTMLGALVEGLEDPRESEALATIIVGGFIGLMSLELSDPDDVTFNGKVEAFMHLLGHSSIEAEARVPATTAAIEAIDGRGPPEARGGRSRGPAREAHRETPRVRAGHTARATAQASKGKRQR
jgi:AcrR family transcriptional regulator